MTIGDSEIMLACPTLTDSEQADILQEAHEKYKDRNAKYHDAWRPLGSKGSMTQVHFKAVRLLSLLEFGGQEDVEDDLLDLINYAAFTLRALREES